jgi:hypothetical protein
MRAVVFEGTTDEVMAALAYMNAEVAKGEAEAEAVEDEKTYPPTGHVSVEFARRALARLPLSTRQRMVLGAIYQAEDKGVLGTKLHKLFSFSPAQFRGMMGAFGRRMWNTDGPGYGLFFRKEWDGDQGSMRYTLTPEAREAVRLELVED